MNKYILVILILSSIAATQDDRREHQKAGYDQMQSIILLMTNGKYDEAYAKLSPSLQKKITRTDFISDWENQTRMLGEFRRFADLKKAYASKAVDPKYPDNVFLLAECEFIHGNILLRVRCDIRDYLIDEFKYLTSSKYTSPFTPFEDSTLVARQRMIIDGDIVLPATLMRPKKVNGKYPLVIMVHGSGPNDRDETIGKSKPFRDIAYGLVRHGIASLRYDKRSYVLPEWFASKPFTIKDEVIDDALNAVRYALTLPEIDHNRIYLLGHSLGGMLAPRIAELDKRIKGIILLAAPARPLEDLIVEQTQYLASIDSVTPRAMLDVQVAMIDTLAAKIKRLTTADASRIDLLFGAPPAYYLDLRSYDPVKTAASLTNRRILVLQGERDYQVTMTDFAMFRSALKGNNVSFKSYPALNHLFFEGVGKSTPKEYTQAHTIPDYVIDDIARWLLQ